MFDVSIIGAISGVLAHVVFFVRGEWHVQSPYVFRFYVLCLALLAAAYHFRIGQDIASSIVNAVHLGLWHIIGLFGSIFCYRGFFHPLRAYPGPRLAKYSKLWHVWQARTSQNYLFLESLHEKYGDVVRTGPNEVTVFHPDGLNAVNRTKDAARSDWYDLLHPSFSINTVRDQGLHDRRRKLWEPAFAPEAMRDYEQRIRKYATRVEASIQQVASNSVKKAIEMNSYIYRFAYDVMADLAFAKETSETDMRWEQSVKTMHKGLAILGPLTPAPWIALLVFSFEWVPLVKEWNTMMAFCKQCMADRVALSPPPKIRDISAWLIEDAERRGQLGTAEEQRWLNGDAFSVILAGSDTTASTMIFAFSYLAKRPEYQRRIREELLAASPDEDGDADLISLTHKDFERLHFLNALINETLRLHHPLPSTGARMISNPEGVTIGDHHIPTGTNVIAPRWSYGRCEAHYTRADEFVPERWLDEPSPAGSKEPARIIDRKAFTPWAGGKWACLGKPVALFELRYMISLLVRNYDICLPAGDNGGRVVADYKDQVTAYPGQLDVVFSPRQ